MKFGAKTTSPFAICTMQWFERNYTYLVGGSEKAFLVP
jgi:hypothetical protein